MPSPLKKQEVAAKQKCQEVAQPSRHHRHPKAEQHGPTPKPRSRGFPAAKPQQREQQQAHRGTGDGDHPRHPFVFPKHPEKPPDHQTQQCRVVHIIVLGRDGHRPEEKRRGHSGGGLQPSLQEVMPGLRPDCPIEINHIHPPTRELERKKPSLKENRRQETQKTRRRGKGKPTCFFCAGGAASRRRPPWSRWFGGCDASRSLVSSVTKPQVPRRANIPPGAECRSEKGAALSLDVSPFGTRIEGFPFLLTGWDALP